VGTGTARNLIFLANLHPNAYYYGIDISTEMLKVAKKQIARRGLTETIHISHGLAETLDYKADFGLSAPFDVIFFSFSLSIMLETSLQSALKAAWDNLRPGGVCFLVDFGDLGGWPKWLRSGFQKWLRLFHVEYREEIYDFLKTLSVETYQHEEVLGRYAIIAAATKVI
jgi:S-adenosylmethionine-diacylgycerolhomoserine-N-methlytransferase